jgi:hypothetical protein
MSDIFEIVGVNAEIKIKVKGREKTFTVQDPNYLKKMALIRKMRDLGKNKDTMDTMDLALQDWDCQKKYVQLYVPELTDEQIENMGEHAFRALFETVTDMAAEKFGAHVKKIETEKKSLATPQV